MAISQRSPAPPNCRRRARWIDFDSGPWRRERSQRGADASRQLTAFELVSEQRSTEKSCRSSSRAQYNSAPQAGE